jgi:hypothetical protein
MLNFITAPAAERGGWEADLRTVRGSLSRMAHAAGAVLAVLLGSQLSRGDRKRALGAFIGPRTNTQLVSIFIFLPIQSRQLVPPHAEKIEPPICVAQHF